MPTVADDRIGRTIYADDIKLVKRRLVNTPSRSVEKANLQLINEDRTQLFSRLDSMGSDSKVSPVEKKILQREWTSVQADHNQIAAQAAKWGIIDQSVYLGYSAAFTSLSQMMAVVLDPLAMNTETDISPYGTLRERFENYHSNATLLSESIFRLSSGMLDGLDDRSRLSLRISSSIGVVIPADGTPAVLSVELLRDGIDTTADYDNSCFTWERITTDKPADSAWNSTHDIVGKSITISSLDFVVKSATFYCKFEHQYSQTMRITQIGFITFNEETPGPPGEQGKAYVVEIESTNGLVFRPGSQYTTLIAHVYDGTGEVTEMLSSGAFRWIRTSESALGDEAWNSAHMTGYKEVVLTPADFYGRTSFKCEIREVS
jgi:hypothetical protein